LNFNEGRRELWKNIEGRALRRADADERGQQSQRYHEHAQPQRGADQPGHHTRSS
jgi:hypothetical protein